MSIFSGAFCLDARAALPGDLRQSIRKSIRRTDDDRGQWHEQTATGFYLAKWDSGALGQPAWRSDAQGSVCTVTGDPLAEGMGTASARQTQLDVLMPGYAQPGLEALAHARGSFALVSFCAAQHRLTLGVDMVGLRSLYYTVQNGVVYFATALRILEALPQVAKKPCPTGVLENTVFGFPLGERTPYEGIFTLHECELISFDADGQRAQHYFDWTRIPPTSYSQEEAVAALDAEFKRAVAVRLAGDRRVTAFLSGGMDSRAIVANLIQAGCQVNAVNFSPDDSQDQYFARQFAQAVGPSCRLDFAAWDEAINFSLLAFEALKKIDKDSSRQQADRPAVLWSGDGGSVGLGHVYMSEAMTTLGQRGDVKGMAERFISENGLSFPAGILARPYRETVPDMLLDNVLAEIRRFGMADHGKALYYFLLFNDQRRHLFKHLERMDAHGLEFLTPFYDSRFLQLVASLPVEWGILHRIYAKWFDVLPDFVRATPWQTYPGHVPCPVVHDRELSYQWATRGGREKLSWGRRYEVARAILKHSREFDFGAQYSRSRLVLSSLAHLLGLRNYEYVLHVLHQHRRYFDTRAPQNAGS